VILCYHRVTELERDPQALAVRPDRFDEHMQIIRQIAEPVPLGSLVRDDGVVSASGRRVAVTFDDGYTDNLETARPILERYDIPATVFVVAGMVDDDGEFWWDELDRLLLKTSPPGRELELEMGGRTLLWTMPSGNGSLGATTAGWSLLDPVDPGPVERLYRELDGLFREANHRERESALEVLRAWVGAGSEGRESHRVMGSSELRQLVEGGLVGVGSHGLHHISFAELSRDELSAEMTESRIRLERAVGRPVDEFAYPFGARFLLPADDVSELREAGYRLACVNFEGTVRPGTPCHRLPRFLVRNWTGDEFSERLERWFGVR
jgi:peptidoglycan/xylan/chitin deacetylase (PgdA/CDA1 family)